MHVSLNLFYVIPLLYCPSLSSFLWSPLSPQIDPTLLPRHVCSIPPPLFPLVPTEDLFLLLLLPLTQTPSSVWPWIHHVAKSNLEFLILCLHLLNAGMTDVSNHAVLWGAKDWTLGLVQTRGVFYPQTTSPSPVLMFSWHLCRVCHLMSIMLCHIYPVLSIMKETQQA